MQIGDTFGMLIDRVEAYACWGTFDGLTGYIHCTEWSHTKPIPDDCIPTVGDTIYVQVFRLATESQAELPQDVTFGGEMHVDFAASRALFDSTT